MFHPVRSTNPLKHRTMGLPFKHISRNVFTKTNIHLIFHIVCSMFVFFGFKILNVISLVIRGIRRCEIYFACPPQYILFTKMKSETFLFFLFKRQTFPNLNFSPPFVFLCRKLSCNAMLFITFANLNGGCQSFHPTLSLSSKKPFLLSKNLSLKEVRFVNGRKTLSSPVAKLPFAVLIFYSTRRYLINQMINVRTL